MSTVIKVENLYKEYRLGTIGYGTLREDIQSWWARINGKPDPNSSIGQSSGKPIGPLDHILALNNINLEVKQGERLGIIGNNGAGKTTLLKILSRIASPTKGSVKIKGRVASLIAVGTGFESELTGRENIYLNGSIIGLRKFEIDQRFDEIVDFSGVEQFIDTPVKRYSSGMYVRLGFSVAAYLESDILIVDEVLAVGDAEFRQKALGKMEDVSSGEGRTVLFVSHNMASIRELCNKCILLDEGSLKDMGETEKIVKSYLNQFPSFDKGEYEKKEIDPKKSIQLIKASITDSKGLVRNNLTCDDTITIKLEYDVKKLIPDLFGYLEILTDDGVTVLTTISNDRKDDPMNNLPVGNCIVDVVIPSRVLGRGKYYVYLNMASAHNLTTTMVDDPGRILAFILNDYSTIYGDIRPGFLSIICNWTVRNGDTPNEINK